ncbi:hypothetical protein DPMN_096015 [Dreissena polymorpha]|uniref:Uncharacterized protein n=1 Tax=Dreissena polymorpha TaxID=45954 RepID=A0A9D4L7J8_DREPO|nr:hypothetical protein DPMN_096015 [Dreissena polymorpha]
MLEMAVLSKISLFVTRSHHVITSAHGKNIRKHLLMGSEQRQGFAGIHEAAEDTRL